MAKRKKKRARARRHRTAQRPVIIQLEAPKPKRRKRRKKRNPVAATVVNPKKKRRRRKPKIKGLLAPIQKLLPGKTGRKLAPLAVGASTGVGVLTLTNKYLAPRVSPNVLGAIELGIAILGGGLVDKYVFKGSGLIFGGAVGASAFSRWITPHLPFGGFAGLSEVEEDEIIADIEFVGGLDALGALGDEEGDAVIAGDGGVEEIMDMPLQTGAVGSCVVDGLGILPPKAIGKLPPGLLASLRKRHWVWIIRLGIPPAEIIKMLRLPPAQRRRIVAGWRARYKAGRRMVQKRTGRAWAKHVPARHPHIARRAPGRPPFKTATPRPRRVRHIRRAGQREGRIATQTEAAALHMAGL